MDAPAALQLQKKQYECKEMGHGIFVEKEMSDAISNDNASDGNTLRFDFL